MTFRDRVGLGLLATGLTLTLWAGGSEPTKAPTLTEAPTTLPGSTEAPPGLRHATEREEHVCQENTLRGDGPREGFLCQYVLVDEWGFDVDVVDGDPWGRWNCATMGNFICGPPWDWSDE